MSEYVRFIILSGPRTGSHVLAQALNSAPQITCFREVFNGRLDFIQYSVDGYDDFSARDIALRKDDPVRFLHERIFCQHPEEVRAVGFKFHYGHQWDCPGILDELVGDPKLGLLHLQRRNILRMLVSLKLAEKTGVWLQEGTSKVTRANALRAFRHPVKAIRRVQRLLMRARPPGEIFRSRVTISPEECLTFIIQTRMRTAKFDDLFREHPKRIVFYEDMLHDRDAVLREVQSFLGVEPGPLTITVQRQNAAPVRELLNNYDELYEAFKDTPYATFFD